MPAFKRLETIAAPYQDLSLSPLPRDFYDADRALGYEGLHEMEPLPFVPRGLLHIGDWQRMTALYQDMLSHQPLVMSGLLSLTGYGFFGADALPVHVKRFECLIGQPIGWASDIADAYAAVNQLDDVFEKPLHGNPLGEVLTALLPPDKAVVMASPDHERYGNWIVDMLPRFGMLKTVSPRTPIFLDNLPPWGAYFLAALGIDAARIKPHPARFFSVREAIVPTLTRAGFFLSPAPMIEAWDRVIEHYLRDPAEPTEAKLFLARGESPLDDIMRDNGYVVVDMAALGVREQIGLMQNARIVVGQDGSALLNAVFAKPGLTIGVLNTAGYDNLLHMGIAQIRGHRLAFHPIEDSDGLADFLVALEV